MRSALPPAFKYLAIAGLVTTLSCAKAHLDESSDAADTSASGMVAALAGGALSTSNANSTQAFVAPKSFDLIPKAYAADLCPTFHSTGIECSATGADMWLTYLSCTFGVSPAEWTGTQLLRMTGATNASCGTFPNPGANQHLIRQAVIGDGQTTPGLIMVARDNIEVTIDDASANLNNFDNQVISTVANNGYGSNVGFNASGARSTLILKRRVLSTGLFDWSVDGSLSVDEAASTSTSRNINGTVKVYHNLLKVVATSTFTNVSHSNLCCTPVSGTISTTFSTGQHVGPTLLGSLLIGKTESLTFTGCGTGTLTKADGEQENVTLHRCF